MTTAQRRAVRWSTIRPADEAVISDDYRRGVRVAELAKRYDVSIRTIYRHIDRAAWPVRRAEVDGWYALFRLDAYGPVQVSPWLPADEVAA